MKQKIGILVSLCILTSALLALAGCGPKLEEPVFVKDLVCAEDMDIDVRYITDKDWKPQVTSASIPGAPEDVKISVYGEGTEETNDGYHIHTVELGLSGDVLSTEEGLTIQKIELTWEDGSTRTADVGEIRICSKEGGAIVYADQDSEDFSEDVSMQGISFKAKQALDITGLEVPYEEIARQMDFSAAINGRKAESIDEKHPLHLEKGETCKVEYQYNSQLESKYGSIFMEAWVTGVDENGKKQFSPIRIRNMDGLGYDAGAYIKRLQEE